MAHKLDEVKSPQEEARLQLRESYREKLRKYFSSQSVFKFIPINIKALLIEWLILIDWARGRKFSGKIEISEDTFGSGDEPFEAKLSDLIEDFSFLITPAFKAYEGFLYYLLEYFKISSKKFEKHYTNVGFFYNLEGQDKDREEILKLIRKKMPDAAGIEGWKELYGVLKRYRHHPAHYLGGKLSTIEQADRYGQTLISAIDGMVVYILDKSL
jgi:hypothetical protein